MGRIACSLLVGALLSGQASAVPQSSWQQLHDRVAQLAQQRQFDAMLATAIEARRVAESSFGPDHPATAVSAYDVAFAYDSLGQLTQAEAAYRESLALEEKAFGPDHPETLKCLNNLAMVYVRNGHREQAEPLLLRVVRTGRSSTDPGVNVGVAVAAFNLAEQYSERGRFTESDPLYEASLSAVNKAAGNAPLTSDYILYRFAFSYLKQRKADQSETLLKRALAIRENAQNRNTLPTAEILSALANIYRDRGDYSLSESFFRRVLTVREAVLGPNHPDVARALVSVGVLANDQHHFAEALNACQRAASIADKPGANDASIGAEAWTCVGAGYLQQDRFGEAETAFKRSVEILRAFSSQPTMKLGMALNGLGEVYRSAAKFAEAEAPFRESLDTMKRLAGEDSEEYAMVLNNLGLLFKDQSRYTEAESLHLRSLAIIERASGSDHISATYPLNALASLYMEQGRSRDAEPMLRRALRIREAVYGVDNPSVATLINNLAALYSNLGRYAEAEPLYRRALAVDEKALGPEHPIVGTDNGNLGRTYSSLNRPAEAEVLLRRSLVIAERSLGPDHPGMIYALRNLGSFYYGRGDFSRAEPLFDRTLEALERQFRYQFTYMSEKDRLSFLATMQDTFSLYLSFCFKFQQRQPALAGKMYDLALWQKGLVARSISSLRRQITASGDPEATAALERLSSKKAQIAALRQAQLTTPGASREAITALEKESNELETMLVRRSATYSEGERLAGLKWQDLSQKLQADEAAIEFLRFDYRDERGWTGDSYYIAMVLSRSSSTGPKLVWLGKATDLEGSPLQDYRTLVGTVPPDDKTGTIFYDTVWHRLEPELAGVKRVYLSPAGIFNEVSWSVIPTGNGRVISDSYEIQLLLSTRDLMRVPPAPAGRSAVLVGDPDFDLTEAGQRSAIRSIHGTNPPSNGSANNSVSRSGVSENAVLLPLKGAQTELQSVRSQLERRGWQATLYTKASALEETVKASRAPRLLHIATHGFFAADPEHIHVDSPVGDSALPAEPMLRSMLYFAGANRTLKGSVPAAGLDDGVLTAFEASELNLRGTELVVLSACETGLGVTRNGEGVFGLRRAFQEAGAEAVLMSLWKVPDRETEELMTIFYETWLAGATKQAALRKAQLEMRERSRARREGQNIPYYWGAFVLVGR